MPVLRYFVSIGCVLAALLFVANWVWPNEPKAPAQQFATESPVEQTIRIQSERRWPDKIVFDTTQPTIVPSPSPAMVAPAPPPPLVVADNSPLDAHAEIKPVAKPATPPKRQARAHRRAPHPAGSTWAYAAPPPPMAPSWPMFRW